MDRVPDRGTNDLGIGDLPAPEVVDEVGGEGSRAGVAVIHQRFDPLGVELLALEFAHQRAFQPLHPGVVRVGVVQDAVVRGVAAEFLDRGGQAALEIEAVVVVEQAVEVGGAAEIGAADVAHARLEGGVGGGAGLLGAVGVAHATQVGGAEFVAVLPGTGAIRQTIDAGAIGPRRGPEDAQGRLATGLHRVVALFQLGAGVGDPAPGDVVARQRFVAGVAQFLAQRAQGLVQGRFQLGMPGADRFGRAVQGQTGRPVQPDQLVLVEVAEQSRGGEQRIPASLAIDGVEIQALQPLDDAATVPFRPDAEHVEAEGHHHPLVADGVRGPEDDRLAVAVALVGIECGFTVLPGVGRQLPADGPGDPRGNQIR